MEMKDRLYKYLLKQKDVVNYDKLEEALHITTAEEKKELENAIEELEKEYKLYISKNHQYILYECSKDKRPGEISINSVGDGYVRVFNFPDEQNDDIKIPKEELKYALDKDIVAAEILGRNEKNKREGRVIKILNRDLSNIVGEIVNGEDGLEFKSFDERKATFIMDEDELKKCVEGEIVVVEKLEELSKNQYLVGLKDKLGHKDDPQMDIKIECAKHEVFDEFPQEVIDQVKSIPQEVLDKDRVGRVDLTAKNIFTIDGKDTKDIDDAISIEMSEDGKYYILGVHIADVSYYVEEGSPLDIEAYKRGTSCYPPGVVIPMLPHELSNGICSLNEGEDRCAITCEMKIDRRGLVKEYDVYPSIIHSKKKMNYDDVNATFKALEENDNNVQKVVDEKLCPDKYEPFVGDLKTMLELAHLIRKNRENNGASDFDTKEAKVICDLDGTPLSVEARDRGEGEKLIEDFMISANESVAKILNFCQKYSMQVLTANRVHDFPLLTKIQNFIAFLEKSGHPIKGNLTDIKTVTFKTIREILAQVEFKNEIEKSIISNMAVRSMPKAKYSENPTGHYGLALKWYLHFTSPIRRYPDLMVHRNIRKFIFNIADENELIKNNNEMGAKCLHCSDREVKATEAERECVSMKMAEYMTNFVGQEFDAYVSGVTSYGIFVELPNTVSGMIRKDSLKGYYYDEENQMFTSKGRKPIKIGDSFRVKCVAASKEEKQITFEMVKELENKNNHNNVKEKKLVKNYDRN